MFPSLTVKERVEKESLFSVLEPASFTFCTFVDGPPVTYSLS